MKIAWLECATGISGDMTLAALIDAGVDREAIRAAIASLNIPDVSLRIETVIRNGFRSTHVLVDHPKQHAHRNFTDICGILDRATELTPSQRQLARRIFLAVAESEARVHGSTVDRVHFHEVGAVDSIVDIVGAAVGFDLLQADRIVCNYVPVGRGFVHIDHGICPVPAPGTAEILKGIPLADVPIEAELTTPTGAAIVRTLADSFGPMPAMTIEQVGYGCGTMVFSERANILRLFVGTACVPANTEFINLLETNVDDVSGEVIGYVRRKLMDASALDVFTTAVQMKKDRPGVMISVLCRPEHTPRMEEILFRETRTLGIRRTVIQRSVQSRDKVDVTTPWGTVSGKRSWRTGHSASFAPEFSDCARVADQANVPLRDVYLAAESAFLQASQSGTLRSASDHHDHDHDHHGHDHDHHGHDHDHHGHDHDHHGHDHDHHGHDHDHHGHDHH
ncbi:MAG: nickel pincer cofactor biosynthesis protein LarC [Planctomycetaceae bacterium]|nr:nickel pincer cofactor biosynthesis protein LarC [Planctomycetaceae bacterium]